MEKLELKHIASYLPFQLKSVAYYNGLMLINEVTPINIVNLLEDYTSAKIILRPISDIVETCLPDGKIPIVELAKIIGMISNEKFKYKIIDKEIRVHDRSFYFFKGDFKYFDLNAPLPIRNQLQLYEKLFEWHFDVFDLHSKGFCVYYNELK